MGTEGEGPGPGEDPAALQAGARLGRYTLLRRVATGGMAEIYVALSPGVSGAQKRVAIKRILPQLASEDRFVDMLVDEAKITVSLTHPNIAQVYEFARDGDEYFLVMEYVDGRPLNHLMQVVDERGEGTVAIPYAAHVVCEVAKGLHHAHTARDPSGTLRGIVHRDVSPQNVLISFAGDVKLIDFGIARAKGRLNKTSHGVIKGKLRYLAPEIAAGDEPDARADVFCCGIVLFELLTNEAYYAPKTDFEAIEMAMEAPTRSIRAVNPAVPEALEAIAQKALAKDRVDRYASALELSKALRRFLNQAYPEVVPSDFADYVQERFALEIAEQHQADRVAEAVMPDSPQPPVTAAADDVERPYQRIVTRVGSRSDPDVRQVSGADGGRDMDVVPAEDGWEEATEFAAEFATGDATVPPRGGSTPAREPPSRSPSPPGPATVPPRSSEPQSALLAAASDDEPRARRRPWGWGAGIVLLLLLGAGAWHQWGPKSNETEVPAAGKAEVETKQAKTHARVSIQVRPRVRGLAILDGRYRKRLRRGRARFRKLVPGKAHEVVVDAPGYRRFSEKRHLEPGDHWRIELSLEPRLGTIELDGWRGARVTASAGKLVGRRIVEVPILRDVEVKAMDEGKVYWKQTFRLEDESPHRVLIPSPDKGTLQVLSTPRAYVQVPGKKRVRTPAVFELMPGDYVVELYGPKRRKKRFKRSVRAGEKTRLQVRW